MTDFAPCRSVVSFAEDFKKRDLPLHVLVENAGVFLVPHDRTEEGFEVTVGTNYFGKATAAPDRALTVILSVS